MEVARETLFSRNRFFLPKLASLLPLGLRLLPHAFPGIDAGQPPGTSIDYLHVWVTQAAFVGT